MRVLIDTSAWIETLRSDGDSRMKVAVTEATTDGRAVLCEMVLLELWNGARSDPGQQRFLKRLERDVECVPTTAEVWRRAHGLARTLRKAAVSVPAADILIAACARHHELEILHRDAHFDRIAGVT